MSDNINENKRDHAHEYQLRAKKKKRLVCEMDKEKAQDFEAMLKDQGHKLFEVVKRGNKRIYERGEIN